MQANDELLAHARNVQAASTTPPFHFQRDHNLSAVYNSVWIEGCAYWYTENLMSDIEPPH
jgi:hypothetical protein